VFSWSYRALPAAAARLFRLLGLHPGPVISTAAAASLAGLTPVEVRPLLAGLARAHLLAEPAPGWYAFHDLLRAYAARLAGAAGLPGNAAARRRLLDHYLHTANHADGVLDAHRPTVSLDPPSPGSTVERPPDAERALAWFTAEHKGLVAAVRDAAARGFDAHAWRLDWAAAGFLDRRGHWPDAAANLQIGLAAAQRLADRPAQAHMHRVLALMHVRLGRSGDGETHLRRSMDLYGALRDDDGLARAYNYLAWLCHRRGDHSAALGHARRALALYRSTNDVVAQARTLNLAGWYQAQLGMLPQALACSRRALALHVALGDENGQAETCDSLGYAHHRLGHHREAIACFERALRHRAKVDDPAHEAVVLHHLGDAHHGAGEVDAARTAWRRALAGLDALGLPEAAQVREKLRAPP
jgi:tetratricopeptide (TPR) repeat protein